MHQIHCRRWTELPESLREEILVATEGTSGAGAAEWGLAWSIDGKLACYASVVPCEARVDGKPLRVAELRQIVSLPDARGQGIATELMSRVQTLMFDRLGARFGLLFCPEERLPFFARQGWVASPAGVRADPAPKQAAKPLVPMILDPARSPHAIREIDLRGIL